MAGDGHRSDLTLSTLEKGLNVLEALAMANAARGLTLTELARQLGMHRSTLLRFLVTLRARGYINRDPMTDRYFLGVRAFTLAASWLNDHDVRQTAKPFLEDLCDRCQELVHLTILDRGEIVTIERIEGKQAISVKTETGNRRPAYCTASGKAILAYLSSTEVDQILARGMATMTAKTITSRDQMRHHLSEIHERGYAIDDEEHTEGIRWSAAAPVFRYDRSVVAAVSIAGPALRVTPERLAQLGEEVRLVAETISQQLGCAGMSRTTTVKTA